MIILKKEFLFNIIKETPIPHDNPILEITNQKELEAYHNTHYGKEISSKDIPFCHQFDPQTKIEDGDSWFRRKNYTRSAQYYEETLGYSNFLYPALYNLGLSFSHGADIQKTFLHNSHIYKRRNGDTPQEIAAAFFREVIALNPLFNHHLYMLTRKLPGNPNQPKIQYISAFYQLAECLLKGAKVSPQDLINTPYEGSTPENIDPNQVALAFYQKAYLYASEDPSLFKLTQKMQNKIEKLLALNLPQSWVKPQASLVTLEDSAPDLSSAALSMPQEQATQENKEQPLPITTKEQLIAYYEKYYGETARAFSRSMALSRAMGGSTSLSGVGYQAKIEQGDVWFKENYTKAAQYYQHALNYPGSLCEGFYKLGLCFKNGADINKTFLDTCYIYGRRKAETPQDLGAVFFREVIALCPLFDEDAYRKTKKLDDKPSIHYISALYELANCILDGAQVDAQDLINTAYEGHNPEYIHPQHVALAFYQRVQRMINDDPSLAKFNQEITAKINEVLKLNLRPSWRITPAEKTVLNLALSLKNTQETSERCNPPLLHSPNSPSYILTPSTSDNDEATSSSSPPRPWCATEASEWRSHLQEVSSGERKTPRR